MQVEGKSIEECVKEFESIFSNVYGKPEITDFLRQSIASVLLYTKGRMPEKKDDKCSCKYGDGGGCACAKDVYNETIDDCHAVLDEQIQEAKKLSE